MKRDFDIPSIEDPADLKLDLDNLYFNEVVEVKKIKTKEKVYDLVVDTLHNYQTEIGIAHNGG